MATNNNLFLSVNTDMSQSAPAIPDLVLQMALDEIYNGVRILQKTASDANYFPMLASEDLIAGDFIALHNVAGICKMRKANASDNTKVAVGFVTADIVADSWGIVTRSGLHPLLTSLTPAAFYYLSTTSGLITATKPVTVGNIVQPVGYAINATELICDISLQYTQL